VGSGLLVILFIGGHFKLTKLRRYAQSQGSHIWVQRESIPGKKQVECGQQRGGIHDAKGWFYSHTGWDREGGHVGL
jgi:hypothetical protein